MNKFIEGLAYILLHLLVYSVFSLAFSLKIDFMETLRSGLIGLILFSVLQTKLRKAVVDFLKEKDEK